MSLDAVTGMVSVAAPDEASLELFAVDLRQLNCRENDESFRTYKIPLAQLSAWRMAIVEQAPACHEIWRGSGYIRVRDVKHGFIHQSRSEPTFKTDLIQIPCDIP